MCRGLPEALIGRLFPRRFPRGRDHYAVNDRAGHSGYSKTAISHFGVGGFCGVAIHGFKSIGWNRQFESYRVVFAPKSINRTATQACFGGGFKITPLSTATPALEPPYRRARHKTRDNHLWWRWRDESKAFRCAC